MNRKNLEILVAGLRTVPELQFNMGLFCDSFGKGSIKKGTDVQEHMCGSSACAIGWGPSFKGLEIIDTDLTDDFLNISNVATLNYYEYGDRLFKLNDDEWEWCFSGEWDQHDNTVKGAVKRINYFLKNVKSKFQNLYKNILINLEFIKGNEKEIFSSFDVKLKKLLM